MEGVKKLKYDREIYTGIIETGRFVSLPSEGLKRLKLNDVSDCGRFKISEFEVEMSEIPGKEDIKNIIGVHAPVQANCYWCQVYNQRDLVFKFFNIPVRGD